MIELDWEMEEIKFLGALLWTGQMFEVRATAQNYEQLCAEEKVLCILQYLLEHDESFLQDILDRGAELQRQWNTEH